MTRGGGHRVERIGALVHQTVAAALATEVKDPRVGFVTITRVKMSSDGGHALLMVSVLGSPEEQTKALEGLNSARGFLRTRLAQSLSLRVAPDVHFELDRGLEHARNIDRVLQELEKKDEAE
ncbi:MAG TPA: 30S ribosome-binding factor RbfA [Gemmatimonadales bacterium]